MKDKKKAVNPIILLFFVLIFAALLTYIIPSGSFEYETVNGKNVLIPQSFQYTAKNPAGIFDVFHAVVQGQIAAANLVIGILFVGGATNILISTKALDDVIAMFVSKLKKGSRDLVLFVIYGFFSVLGAFLGTISITLSFIPISCAVAKKLGYENTVGVAIPLLGGFGGFMAGPANPLTTGICQSLAGLEMFSGISVRLLLYAIITAGVYLYIIRYAHKTAIPVTDLQQEGLTASADKKGILSVAVFFMGIAFFIYMALTKNWNYIDMCAVFLMTTVVIAFIQKMKPDEYIDKFIAGAKGMLSGALLIGLAQGIELIIRQAGTLNTIIYYLSAIVYKMPSLLSLVLLFVIISIINFFVPSASGKAVLLMPLIMPMCVISGYSYQLGIIIYQLGDGVGKMFLPTVGTLLAALSIGEISYEKWLKFIMPLAVVLNVFSLAFIFACYFGKFGL